MDALGRPVDAKTHLPYHEYGIAVTDIGNKIDLLDGFLLGKINYE
jgi:hypothetical protein